MAYTKELRDWVASQEHVEDTDDWAMVHPLSVAAAHKHLAAFVRLVREEALKQQESEVLKGRGVFARGLVFDALCERFGLEQ